MAIEILQRQACVPGPADCLLEARLVFDDRPGERVAEMRRGSAYRGAPRPGSHAWVRFHALRRAGVGVLRAIGAHVLNGKNSR